MGDQIENSESLKKNKEIEDIKNIFDKIDDFDNMFETSDLEKQPEKQEPKIQVETQIEEIVEK